MTSSIFELLITLPHDILWKILSQAAQISQSIEEPGNIESVNFWPHWNPEGTDNKHHVEADVFICFERLNVIIESKKDNTTTQNPKQWKKEFRSYYNENKRNKDRNIILIAVDGNDNFNPDEIEIEKGEIGKVFKTSWLKLFRACVDHQEDINPVHISLIRECFKLLQIIEYQSLEDIMNKNRIETLDSFKEKIKEASEVFFCLRQAVFDIVNLIGSYTAIPCNIQAPWNRFNRNPFLPTNSNDTNWMNGVEYEVLKGKFGNFYMRLELLFTMNYNVSDQCFENPTVIFMYAVNEEKNVDGRETWIDSSDNDWISSTL